MDEKYDAQEYAKKVLKQYKNNYYLSEIEIQPILAADGSITNLDEFIKNREKTETPLTCSTPVEKIAALAPKAVATILEAIDKMDASYAEKKLVFDQYIENTKEVDEKSLANAFQQFAEVYDEAGLR